VKLSDHEWTTQAALLVKSRGGVWRLRRYTPPLESPLG